ncbi:carboxypeptidase-like regulatory domain-containing protein [uncultured Chitinophaga sp.]|uniref:carboxypeptidase-like regulatory domain-containing protein n=1 Tax=uncultured Chitinophaga sp. TaxID=339340 RepID=UPI002618536D|nr:carboxypeptidase-like regulatory domain-containing protein [uncultured Chitinophaga sp.]
MKPTRLYLITMLLTLVCGAASLPAMAQIETPVTLRGQITSSDGKLVLYPATVRNKQTGARVFSDQGGFYRIAARQGDEIVVSFIGYVSDSVKVVNLAGTQVANIRLKARERFLPQVEVSGKWNAYQLDSIARYEEFRPFLESKEKTLVNTEKRTDGGFGLVFSPFTRGSRKEKDLRKFKKLYDENERQQFVDYRYSKSFVSQVTGLKGDSLTQFTNIYTPSYGMLRTINQEDLIMWISVRAKKWRENPAARMKENE